MVDVVQCQLLAQAVLTLTQRGGAPPNGCHMLAQAEVDALHELRSDGWVVGGTGVSPLTRT
jgi:hypothetical protein